MQYFLVDTHEQKKQAKRGLENQKPKHKHDKQGIQTTPLRGFEMGFLSVASFPRLFASVVVGRGGRRRRALLVRH